MKGTIITLTALMNIFFLSAQKRNDTENKKISPTKYAIVLYSDQVKNKSGDNKMIGAHWQNKAGGNFEWEKNISEDGDYEIAICYASFNNNFSAKFFNDKRDSIVVKLSATSGYYPEKKSWSEFNCERIKLPGKLHLHKGVNNISLELVTEKQDDEMNLYSAELIPVIKTTAIETDHANAVNSHTNTNWFANALYGVMFHWTSQSMPEHGAAKPYGNAVNDFDVNAFVNMVVKTGAHYVIFTTNHAEPYFPAPLKEWEKIYPNHTTQRDLVQEISDGLQKHNIKLFLYMATHVYAKYDSVNDEEFTRLNFTPLREISERYKTSVAGYWFDGWYQCYEKHPQFDFEAFYKICKTGNPERLVGLNTWLYPINTLWQDYWAGELYTIGKPAINQINQNGPARNLQDHNLIVMQTEDWLHTKPDTKISAPHLKADELIDFILKSKGKCPVTINMQIYQDGRIGDEALSVMEQVKKEVNKN